jgi:proton-dependent oligopeptide transporter, POT family
MISMLMGGLVSHRLWGNFLAGFLGSFWEQMPKDQYFLLILAIAGVGTVVLALLLKPLKRAMAER